MNKLCINIHSTRRRTVLLINILSFGLFLIACSTARPAPEQVIEDQAIPEDTAIPLIPLELVVSSGGVYPVRAPLHIQDERLQLIEYDSAGQIKIGHYNEIVFPTDVYVTMSEPDQNLTVFLRRSPHGGCLILWDNEISNFRDPCTGSKFDRSGQYLTGPSGRNLDQLPVSIDDGMIWIGPEVIYGDPHP